MSKSVPWHTRRRKEGKDKVEGRDTTPVIMFRMTSSPTQDPLPRPLLLPFVLDIISSHTFWSTFPSNVHCLRSNISPYRILKCCYNFILIVP